jgi:HAD superfamily hydrolase (TIGR01549 family)
MPIRAISFDLFDTLVDLRMGDGNAMRESVRAMHGAVSEHVDLGLEHFREALVAADHETRARFDPGTEIASEVRFEDLLSHLGVEAPGLADRMTGLHMGILERQVRTPEHHAEVIEALAVRARLALCSNFTHAPTARRVIADAALEAHLDPVVISVELGLRKPRRELFDAVLDGLGTRASETLHVGDNLRADVAGASAVGLRTAWITRQVADPERALSEYEGPRPDFVVADLRELLSLVDSGASSHPSMRENRR